MQETEIGGQEPRLGEERDSQRWTHKGSHSESVSHSHMSLPRRAVYLQKEGPRSTLEGAPEEEGSSQVALLPPDTASEGVSHSTAAPGCGAVGARKEQLINLILKQIYKIVSGFAGNPGKWLLRGIV